MTERDLPLFPLHVVLFPHMALPLHVFEERYKQMMQACLAGDRTFGVVLIKSGREVGGPAVPYPVGTTAHVQALERLPEGRMNLLGTGGERFRVLRTLQEEPYLVARVELWPDESSDISEDLVARVSERYRAYVDALRHLGYDATPRYASEASLFSYEVAAMLRVHPTARQELLELPSVAARLERELKLLGAELNLLRLLSSAPLANDTPGPFSQN